MALLLLGPVLRYISTDAATVWVETDAACQVEVLGRTADTVKVHGHHYALVPIEGLEPGSETEYEVKLDGHRAWPLTSSPYPASRIRTLTDDGNQPHQILFGSCRHATPLALADADSSYDPDALDTYAHHLAKTSTDTWPELLMLLGDQVYGDETSPATRAYIARRRDITVAPAHEVADYEEYTQLYLESWGDPDVRWLLSTLPSTMIFDDHDVRDDWNTSKAWREKMAKTDWWPSRITGGLASYWIYQHLGNLSPAELAAEPLWAKVRAISAAGGDAWETLAEFAAEADKEVDGGKSYRWSFRRDIAGVRIIVLDSRCGRILEGDRRSMVSDAEFDWFAEQLRGDYDHLLVGSSLPWLLPRAIHDLEAASEAICAGAWGSRAAALGEKARQKADMEHWASMRESFDRLTGLLTAVGRGEFGTRAPATVNVLSGDVHHAYVAQAELPGLRTDRGDSRVYQLTCSPVHNDVPWFMRVAFRIGWRRAAAGVTRLLTSAARVAKPGLRWRRLAGPYFGNMIATLTVHGRAAHVEINNARPGPDGSQVLEKTVQIPLAWRAPTNR